MAASARSRAIRARILSNSFLEVLCLWASLLANNFVQVTPASFHKLLAAPQNCGEEVIARLDLLPELFCRISRDVDLSSEARLRLAQRRREIGETRSADDHQIHVTPGLFLTSRHGTVDKSTLNPASERL